MKALWRWLRFMFDVFFLTIAVILAGTFIATQEWAWALIWIVMVPIGLGNIFGVWRDRV